MTVSIPDFSKAHVVVAGDVMLDRYLFGSTGRISPEAPVPVVHVHETDDRPGGAANVAVNLASLGVSTRLIGVVGNDDAADSLRSILKGRGIACDFCSVRNRPTITKTRVQSRGQQLIRLDQEETTTMPGGEVLKLLRKAIKGAGAVVLSDYGKGALSDVAAMISACRDAGVPVLVDPKGRDFEKYRGASVITPNQAEFEAVAGECHSDEQLVDRARTMLDDLELDALLVTRSEKGMLLLEADMEPVFLSTQAREVFDVTGAGDTVIATLAGSLASGQSLTSSSALANLAAGLVVRKIGVASVTPGEISVALHERGQGGRGPLGLEALKLVVAQSRERGERIIMTNGCFDILHAGHVAYLEEAKNLGDRLIVAVNDDASVRRLKGEKRPINALQDRLLVLAGLAAVDWVVPFSGDTPASLIAEVLPDVLVKGGDYKPEDIAGAKDVLRNGGEVRVLAFRDGHSSSRIIDKLSD
ncbi:MAG: bifunctional D-glycero-beta-D-manno-heptose-7-phosphate kinase/D-glycero-beta-D-manno-heptose 1-phosphate adenylyltransferase HldE [Gammaproteobacteria bacterium]|nr:bifunctional D-glycero-beta-D-manno-heptose-7-phosphate kinase/D-glycero-beta-D-manno-heptose 1-phosphate adenylyltransferase HldE [Gammaproteobacteria bacterium]MDH5241680.1 bifunctional D-glycero-beta-D-manno-heptose-7-phosphate kinase/D-glycero-beta-D-manno-heptose 1-phosphate adenylyltransferase HldE [Gammaproteobacteria bacterium]MDH5261523.1 bifunctional D-glycero-beta-D-manno-heptose-7-phosphate kinase/D-glycero-beta-D-manno-heptose 1-phosphate adenylyltransferase HldE [Gammaproteobacte